MRSINREEKEECESFDTLSDLEIHKKYWEFVFSRLIQGITEGTTKTIEKVRNFAYSEFSQSILKFLKDGLEEKTKQV